MHECLLVLVIGADARGWLLVDEFYYMTIRIVDGRVVKVGTRRGAPDEETCRIEGHF